MLEHGNTIPKPNLVMLEGRKYEIVCCFATFGERLQFTPNSASQLPKIYGGSANLVSAYISVCLRFAFSKLFSS